MIFKLPQKFADKQLDNFIYKVYQSYTKNPKDKFVFDLTEVEFIANQELLVISLLLKSFVKNKVEFEVRFFKKGVPIGDIPIPDRVKRQLIEIWVVWEIWRIIPDEEYSDNKYFGIDGNSIQRLQEEINYYPKRSEINRRHGVTPFVEIDFINNYNAIEIRKRVEKVYRLNSAIRELLNVNNCSHPFTSNSLSTIITEELYLNFLDHSQDSAFKGLDQNAAMSISFENKLDRSKHTEEKIQKIKYTNFKSECLPETKSFFLDEKKKEFNNKPIIEFSFLDFGIGIPATLRNEYLKVKRISEDKLQDNDLLRFAFNHNTSRHPITIFDNRPENYIPRGLFDALTIVRRYNGMLIVRSNYGKVLYDFSHTQNIDEAFKTFGDSKLFFPGTLISIYIPAIENLLKLDQSVIKPITIFSHLKPKKTIYLNINQIVKSNLNKSILYSSVLLELKNRITLVKDTSLVYISFLNSNFEDRVTRKILYFLLSDYDINNNLNVVILHSPKKSLLNQISDELLALSSAIKNYKIHPLPILDYDIVLNTIHLRWLGVFDKSDVNKLNDLLYGNEQHSLSRSNFNDPDNLTGHIISFDTYGNVVSNLPDRQQLISSFKAENDVLTSSEVENLLNGSNCIIEDNNKDIYLCSGNYYQKKYIEVNNLIGDENQLIRLTNLLFDKLKYRINFLDDCYFMGVTATSDKILRTLQKQGHITNFFSFDNYSSFVKEVSEGKIPLNSNYILIGDVISTGFLTSKIGDRLREYNCKLKGVGAIASVIDEDFRDTREFLAKYEDKIISLYESTTQKFEFNEIKNELFEKKCIRINPYTNNPIRLSFKETNYNDSIIFHSTVQFEPKTNTIKIDNEFLDSIDNENIRVGYFKFNNLIHPYFFNINEILPKIEVNLLRKIFNKINNLGLNIEPLQIFYPKGSGIDSLEFFTKIKSALKNDFIEETEIDRIKTEKGWRFPHNSKNLGEKIKDRLCLILDDGSCSGDSLIQMIDEISFYEAKEIILFCFIGRVNDHKREFFSRLSKVKVKNGDDVNLSIFFISHWHIPTYYLDNNPISNESNWLKNLIKIANTPNGIKSIAEKILQEIRAKDKDDYTDYKYLPTIKETRKKPKKDLLIIREEIGKVIGYRLYKESFSFFDAFIQKYSRRQQTKDRYKEIELLCACLIYEPYLYDRIVNVLPDVTEQIEKFTTVLIFDFKRFEKYQSYNWDKKDIIHLFFIVFKDKPLFNLLTKENLTKIIDFTKPIESSLNYVLFKLLKYFPFDKSNVTHYSFDEDIKLIIREFLNNGDCPRELRQFYNFISTLPSKNDFKSSLLKLKDLYKKQKDKDYHDQRRSFSHNISVIVTTAKKLKVQSERKVLFQEEDLKKIEHSWIRILEFINPIIEFTFSYIDYLAPFPNNEFVNQSQYLRESVGYIEEFIYSETEKMNDIDKLLKTIKYLEAIQRYYDLNSDFHFSIENNTYILDYYIDELIKKLEEICNLQVINRKEFKKHRKINIPENYVMKILVKEPIVNLYKYGNLKDYPVELSFEELQNSCFKITLKNRIAASPQDGNGEGHRCLKSLADTDKFGFGYKAIKGTGFYLQEFHFELA